MAKSGDKSAINTTKKNANVTEKERNTTEKTTEKDSKTTDKFLEVICSNPRITNRELAEMFGLTEDGVFFRTKKLRMLGRIRRVKGKKKGYWEIIPTDR